MTTQLAAPLAAYPARARTPLVWAVVAGVAGLVALVLLILFFALARPWDDWMSEFDWLGPVNDGAVVVQFAALVPVALAVRARAPGRLADWATVAGVASMCGVVVLQLLLLTGLVAFEDQVGLVIACTAVTWGWLFGISRGLPRTLARFGRVVAASGLAGYLIFGAGLLLPDGSFWQYAVFGIGGVAGLAGWFGFPVWPLLWARHVSREER